MMMSNEDFWRVYGGGPNKYFKGFASALEYILPFAFGYLIMFTMLFILKGVFLLIATVICVLIETIEVVIFSL